MEQLIAQAKKQFDDILSHVQGKAQTQQLNEVEKGIFYALLRLGLTLLLVFFQQKGVGYKGKVYADKEGTKRPYHSIKTREYLSIFGRVSIPRACYWAKGCHEIYPLDAELNLPEGEHSYVLQEWGATLGSEEPYEKAANFLETVLGVPLWGSMMETVMNKSCVNVPKFYENRQGPEAGTEKEIIVATGDGKGVVMRKDQMKKKTVKKRLRKMRKEGERIKKKKADEEKKRLGKKKMSTVIGVYTIDRHNRTAGDFLSKKKETQQRPRPCNKVVQATLEGKETAFQRLKEEVVKRDPDKKKEGVALVDGEHKLRQLMKKYLPWFLIIIDIYHMYLKRGYPIGSGVVEGACKNLVKDRMEQCGMRWTMGGAEAVLRMRSIQINGMTSDYWKYHITQEKQRLYGNLVEDGSMELAA